jgi:hypothetical protein
MIPHPTTARTRTPIRTTLTIRVIAAGAARARLAAQQSARQSQHLLVVVRGRQTRRRLDETSIAVTAMAIHASATTTHAGTAMTSAAATTHGRVEGCRLSTSRETGSVASLRTAVPTTMLGSVARLWMIPASAALGTTHASVTYGTTRENAAVLVMTRVNEPAGTPQTTAVRERTRGSVAGNRHRPRRPSL